MSYQHILLVTDLKEDSDQVAQKAKAILHWQEDAKLSILHVVQDTMVGFGYELVPVATLYEVDDERCQEAKQEMSEFIQRNDLTTESESMNAEVMTAISSAEGIISYCHKHKVDLIVIGRHERHGLSAFLKGSTVDNIIADIKCDTLVVHLG